MRAWQGAGFLGLAVALGAASASATPVTYNFTGGQVSVAAFVGATQISGPVVIDLDGVSVTVDEALFTLSSLTFSVGTSGSLSLSPDYLGYDTVNLDFATVIGVGGSLTLVDPGPPTEYGFAISGVTVTGQLDASGPSVTPIVDGPFSISGVTGSGTIFIESNQLFLDGITLGAIDPDGEGGVAPLVIKGDFIFIGLVPEPGTALLLGLGLAGLARARRHPRA